jgi:hypothetical protein
VTGEQTKPTEAELRELAARGAAELDGASATKLPQWTEENFGGVNGPRATSTSVGSTPTPRTAKPQPTTTARRPTAGTSE